MKILVVSYAYLPNIGGIERVSSELNEGLFRRGHQIQVVTHQPNAQSETFPVWSRPSYAKQIQLHRWADVILFHNMSLNYAALALLPGRPVVCVSHGFYGFIDQNARGALLRFLIRRSTNIAVSQFIASKLPAPARVIWNPIHIPEPSEVPSSEARPRDILFVGRLVRGKGVHVLLDALKSWPGEGRPSVTIVGEGEERAALEAQKIAANLNTVEFAGPLSKAEVEAQLREHKLIAVPSTDVEGLGLVALEGIAWGCIPVASDIGGLPEAVGSCGRVVPPGEPAQWAETLHELLGDANQCSELLRGRAKFLQTVHFESVLDAYEAIIGSATAQ